MVFACPLTHVIHFYFTLSQIPGDIGDTTPQFFLKLGNYRSVSILSITYQITLYVQKRIIDTGMMMIDL